MNTNCNSLKLGINTFYYRLVQKIGAWAIIVVALLCCSTIFAQRLVFPGQELLTPSLLDPSFVGDKGYVSAMGMLQVTDYPRKQSTQYINAQFPLLEKVSFGVDYFRDFVDYFSYSTAMASANIRFDLGDTDHYVKLGVSGGVDARRQDRLPLDPVPNMEPFVTTLTENELDFAYRAGLHYNWNDLTIGGSYNKLPIQSILVREGLEDMIGYWIKEGFTVHVRYGVNVSDAFRLTPVFRYLSYANDPIYEGALLVDVGNWVSASVSYKNDYSVNPAVRFELFDALQIGYSYEMAIGDVDFEDLHSLSISYKIGEDKSVEPDWVKTAQANNKKIDAIKPSKPKKEKEPEPLPVIEEEVVPEVIEKESPVAMNEVQVGNIKNGLVLNSGYYIIVGTFETKEEAETERTRLKKMDYYTAIGKQSGDNKFYLYIDSDIDKTNAEKRLRAHKLDRNFRNAYLLQVN